MKIVPSILAETAEDFERRMREAESFARYVQIDLMDGVFVETTGIPPEEINAMKTTLAFEVHLMVRDPLAFVDRIRHAGLKKVLFHFEAADDHAGIVGKIMERNLAAGIAVKPETDLRRLSGAAELVDTLLFLTVDPCCYGHPFKPEVIEKVASARKAFPDKTIGVDGGVSLDNLAMFADIGVDYVCVGSRIFLNGDPEKNYLSFAGRVKEIGKR